MYHLIPSTLDKDIISGNALELPASETFLEFLLSMILKLCFHTCLYILQIRPNCNSWSIRCPPINVVYRKTEITAFQKGIKSKAAQPTVVHFKFKNRNNLN